MNPQPATRPLRARHDVALLGAMLLSVGLFGVWNRYGEYRQVEDEQRHLLATQALAVGVNLARELGATVAALRDAGDDIAPQVDAALAQRRLATLGRSQPGLTHLIRLDAGGRVVAASDPLPPGTDLSARDDFRRARDAFDPERPLLSRPSKATDGHYAMSLTVAVAAPDGRFDGIVSATLEPAYFRAPLGAMLYAADMRAGVLHGDGQVLMFEPPVAALAGNDLDRPGTMYRRHRESGQVAIVLTGPSATGEERMTALRTVQMSPETGLAFDRAPVVTVSRSTDAMFSTWRRQTLAYLAMFGLFVAMTTVAAVATRRRLRDVERLENERKAIERQGADRLELALRGADLGLWDLHVPSGHATVNERWNSMLGLPHDPDCGTTGWQERVHPDDWPRVSAAQQAHLDGRTERYEEVYRMRHADGHWVWILDRGQVLERDANGAPLRMVGTHMDTSERMEAQLALQRSEQSLATTLNSIGDAVIATDAQGHVVRMNAMAQRLTGWPLAEATGLPLERVFRIVDARTRAPVVDAVRQVVESGQVIGLANDTVLVARDGTEFQVADSAAPIRTPQGEVTGVVLVFSDVTESFRVQQALRANEVRLRSLLDNLRSGVIVHGADSRVLDANPSACALTGLSLAQMRGKVAIDPYWKFIEEDHSPMPLERYPVKQVLAGNGVVRNLVLGVSRPDLQEPVWVLVNAYPTRDVEGGIDTVVVTFSDISERKVAEERLRDSEALKTSVLDSLSAHIAVLDGDGIIIAVNDAWRSFARDNGAPEGAVEPLGVSYLDLCSSTVGTRAGLDARAALGGILAVLGGERDEFSREYPCHSPTEQRWFRMSVTRIRGARGGAVVSHMPITELKRAELRTLATQGELRATLDAIPDLLFELGRDGRFYNFHSPRRDLLYADPVAFLGRTVPEVLPAAAWQVVDSALAQAAESGFSSGLRYELDLPGGTHWFELSVARKPVPEGEPPRFICLARDITERHNAERDRQLLELQLREAQKIESIGTLAGGIAHDFNNILAAILGNVALAQQDAAAGRPVHESLAQINRAGARARHLVQQILTFSRRDQHGFANQPLGPIVDETFSLLRATLPAGVRLDKVLPGLPLAVHGDSTQLQQVLMNLCTNAWHALPPRGGRIEVGAASISADEALRQRLPGPPSGRCVHLWVSDNGSGMEEATRLRIFDPFFTTKPVGQGTGLGLAVVHGIVRAHGGAITVDSQPGLGTTVHLYFPEPEPGPGVVASAAAPAVDAAKPGAGQHVLYVDDDDVMAVMVERLLHRAGFRVTASTDSTAAIALLREHPARFDAVVTDFNMPERSGIEVAREALRLQPERPVVLSSGYLSDALREQAARAGVRALMRKENTIDELVELLCQLLRPTQDEPDLAE